MGRPRVLRPQLRRDSLGGARELHGLPGPVPKRSLKLSARIPPYQAPRNAWRRRIHQAVVEAKARRDISYRPTDRLEVHVRLYMSSGALTSNDVDNRLKDVLDALQGRAGGSKRAPTLPPIIPNDRQVYRVVVEKGPAPKQSRGLGHLTIRRFAGLA